MKIPIEIPAVEAIAEHNEAAFEALLPILSSHDPQFVVIRFDNREFRDEVIENLIGNVPELQHVVLDLSKTKVESFAETLKDKMPPALAEAKEVANIIHTINLEGSLLAEMMAGGRS